VAAAAADRARRILSWVLGALVIALVLSWLYAALWPRRERSLAGANGRLIRVQVWNGSMEGGVGARVATYLRQGGFQVVEVGNADRHDYVATMVVARRPDAAAARIVAQYLGSPPVIRQAWTSDVAEVTVVIGSDRSRLRVQ
jgi:LytR cell envelope-related transcriptional attenuator